MWTDAKVRVSQPKLNK